MPRHLLHILRLLVLASALGCLPAFASELKPFTSDGCSVFPEGTAQQQRLWLDCCIQHDYAYWQGGTYQQRKQADKELKRCVEGVGQAKIAALMLAGVRVGGSPYFPLVFAGVTVGPTLGSTGP